MLLLSFNLKSWAHSTFGANKESHIDVVDAPLKSYAGVDLQDEDEKTALIFSTNQVHLHIVRHFLSVSYLSPNS